MIRVLTLALVACAAACGAAGSDWEGGIHARMGHSDDLGLRVVDVPSDGPAARAGLREDDIILEIDGMPVEGLTPAQIAERLRGPVGSKVTLRVDRRSRPLTLEIERAPYAEGE